jgi:fido (protein-threonine AMPylation protein)
MRPRFVDQVRLLVEDAVAGKYPSVSAESILGWVTKVNRVLETRGPSGVKVSPTNDFGSDVVNQTICLWQIENIWRKGALPSGILRAVHRTAYGLFESAPQLRETATVKDFERDFLTRPSEISMKLAELEIEFLGGLSLKAAGRTAQADFLAKFWGKFIAVHPFQDGNGRTVRLATQLLLRRWNYPFLPLPKVRNDPTWKAALHSAVQGRPSDLAAIFDRKLLENRKSDRLI